MVTDAYIYANARIAAREASLLTQQQVEQLLSARDADEAFDALHGTFLAPHIAGGTRADLARLLRKALSAAKKLIDDIVPDPTPFTILWLRYDFFNLKTIVKGRRAGLDDAAIIARCFYAAHYAPERLLAAVDKGDVAAVSADLAVAYDAMVDAAQVYEIDRIANMGYFRTVARIARTCREPFVRAYARRIIDFFNCATQLRLTYLPYDIDAASVFVDGGTAPWSAYASRDAIFARYRALGVPAAAIEDFRATGNFAILAKAADDALLAFIKAQPATVESIVPVFGYFIALRNNTQIVRTIIAGKESGMAEADLRRIMRRLYTERV